MSDQVTNNLLLKGCILTSDSESRQCDILVRNGIIAEIGESLTSPDNFEVFHADGLTVSYGLADPHVHFRVPGNPEKETIKTGSEAAAAGGYTAVCTMPNLIPAPDSEEHIELQKNLIRKDAIIDVFPFATITKERKGRELVDFAALAPLIVGFSDDGNGVQDDGLMKEAMTRIAEADSILSAHCEVNELLRGGYIHDGEYCRLHGHKGICSESEWRQIERDVRMAADTGCRYHVCHISTKESVEIIRDARKDGVRVSCETGPHYLTFADKDLQEDGRFKMNPPIRSTRDREALLEGIEDGTIEVIATDHAPHTADEKSRGLEKSFMGVVGLETAFGACYTALCLTGIVSIDKLFSLMGRNARRIFRLGGELRVGEPADLTLFDTESIWTVRPELFRTKGRATPYQGMKLTGRPVATFFRGRNVYMDKGKNNMTE